MKVILALCMVALIAGSSLADEAVPESISKHKWALRPKGGELIKSVNWPQAPVPIPRRIFGEVGREVVVIPTSLSECEAKTKDGTWAQYVREKMQSDDGVYSCMFSDNPNYNSLSELEPTPTKEQLEWAQGLPDRWLLPPLDGYRHAVKPKGLIATWDQLDNGNTARVAAAQNMSPIKGSGGMDAYVCWYDRPLSTEGVLFEFIGTANSEEGYRIKLEKVGGAIVTIREDRERKQLYLAWPSGNFIVMLRMPPGMRGQELPRYLERYPSNWTKTWDLDLRGLMVKELTEAIEQMSRNVDGPLEFLRYSFRVYPFDEGFRRARRAIAHFGPFYDFHKQSLENIKTNWIKTPADQIKVADYREAMLAHRRELITRLIAERDRMTRDGIEPKGE
jgi:hypothetical protein